jgi:hypothetical protein
MKTRFQMSDLRLLS